MALLTVNSVQREVEADSTTPLLWVLRDHLGLMGTRFGCGVGLCGCCTVHINGEAVRSCVTTLADAEGSQITTIEGLGTSERPHPVQAAWLEVDVAQCGYCQSGQIMQAAALLATNPQPTDADIDGAMSGNLCRCGTYQRIRDAIHRATELQR
ncbi:(2Fe-2S)-binding protein [Mesorhizobium sp. YR577]|uniref:(2Fe-2S)-binding protein n=1 Tax=Mesorhizobium sp. YR577 TaxID=1884373 RepID=UPI0008E57C8E|nr:(2Fe-2S)-binding protein [Mesorhizobium sp. YR577]SFU22337.1 isoquinoline 1-oxidoreductase, alpha subunit [Mesorhizobium sp. YR577]